MRKNKKLWSFALAGAMAVSNLSGVVAAPFTTIVAQAANVAGDLQFDAASYALTKGDATKELKTGLQIYDEGQGKFVPIEEQQVVYSIESGEDAIKLQNGVVSVIGGQLPATEKTATVKATFEGKSATVNIVVSAKPTITGLTLTSKDQVANIPDYCDELRNFIDGNGVDGLKLTATETYNDKAADADIKFAIFAKDAEEKDNTFTINPDAGTPGDTSVEDVFEVSAGASTKAGAYTAFVWIDEEGGTVNGIDEGEWVAEWDFTVVKCATTLTVKDEKGKTASDPLKVGQTSPRLSLYADKSEITSDVKWAATKTGDAAVMTVNESTGEATITKASTEATTTDTINAEYQLNADLSYKVSGAYTVNIAKEVEATYAVGFVDEEGKPLESLNIEGGKSIFAQMTYGDKVLEGVEWSIPSTTAATIDKNSGMITAKVVGADTNVEVTGQYFDGTTNITKTGTITVKKLTYKYSIEGAEGEPTATTANIREGKTATISISKSTGDPFDGEIKWKSSNLNVATVSDDGVISVLDGASKLGTKTAVISPLLDGKAIEGADDFTITAVAYEKKYTVETDKESLFYGESATLSASYEDEDGEKIPVTDGTWKIEGTGDLAPATAVETNGNKLEVVSDVTAGGIVEVGFYTKDNKSDTPDKTVSVTVKAKVYALSIDGGEPIEAANKKIAGTIANMEIGETHTLSVTSGADDITNKMKWAPDEDSKDYVSIQNGTITALKEGIDAKVTGTYTLDNVEALTVEVTVSQIFSETDAEEIAKDASAKAGDASTAAGKAVEAAGEAEGLAAAAIEDPTEENLKKAQDALDKATENLGTAEKAYAAAVEACAAAEAEGAKSTEAKKAVADAKADLEKAETAVNNAKAAVKKAEGAVTEATGVVTDKVKKDAIAAANTAAEKAVKDPTDANIQAAKDAVAAAKKANATDAELKEANENITKAEAANAEAKKKAEEEAKAADDSAKGTPAPVGTELVDANGNKTGFKVTDANASAPEVEYEGPSDKNATKADIPETYTDLSGNVYKVVGIDARAFKDTKVKTVTIRKNIKRIDPKAFEKSKVKNVKIKGTKLTKKMAKSFKKLKKGGKIKCSGSHKKKNKEILNNLPNVKNGKTKVK